jgi:hypothetical protein
MPPNTFKRRENKGEIYVKNIRKNSRRIRNRIRIRRSIRNKMIVGSGSEKEHSGSTTLISGVGKKNIR